MNNLKSKLFHVCPKTSKIVGFRPPSRPLLWLSPFVGLAALAWFLIRVVPKPSRAAYPCQRLALPLASGFVLWVLSALTSALPFFKKSLGFSQKWLLNIALCLVIGAAALVGEVSGITAPAQVSYTPHPANDPIGFAQGLVPGRVAWVYNPAVTDWAGPNSGQMWYEHVDQAVAGDMFSWALRGYANQDTEAAAWNAIFSHYNGGPTYQPGEKILIKINLTTANAGGGFGDDNYNQLVKSGVTLDSTANAPQLMHALLDQLINVVGVAQSDITIGDPTGLFVNYLYYPLHNDFPNVRYEDNRGGTGPEGESTRRALAEYTSPCVPYYWSTPDADGKTQDCVVQSYYDATYIINFSVLKSHDRAGITVAAKNHYGSMLRTPIGQGRTLGTNHYNVHDRLPLQPTNTAWQNMGYYRPLVDLMGNAYTGGKTVLYLVDGIFGGKGWNSVASTWSMAPFNGDWPSSLFISMDPVAIDSVAFDFLGQKWPEHALAYEGVQDFLHEAALADNPPSGTCYDPEHDGVCMTSLGVHEHWNNSSDKKYSRNLGVGNGIELLYLTSEPGTVDLTVAVVGNGTTLPAAGVHSYTTGSVVAIAASPSVGYTFDHWSGACSGSGTCSVTMDANKSVTAHFIAGSTFSLDLVAGWNLVSFPLHPANTEISSVLSTISGSYSLVYVWDASASSGNWRTYDPSAPPYANTLATLDEKMGFWIQMTTARTLTISGAPPVATQIALSSSGGGWNLVGYPSETAGSLPDILTTHGVGSGFSIIYAYHAADTADFWKLYRPDGPAFANDLSGLTRGYGYWIDVNAPATWEVEY
jgi:hypothetical protein